MACYLVDTCMRANIYIRASTEEEAITKAKDILLLLGKSAEDICTVEVTIGNLEKTKNEEGAKYGRP